MAGLIRFLVLTVFIQFFAIPVADYEKPAHSRFDKISLYSVVSCVLQNPTEEQKAQPRRKGKFSTPFGLGECTFSVSNFERAEMNCIFFNLYFNPVASSYQGSKLEVLNSRSHPPTS